MIASSRALVEGDGDEDSAKERALAATAAAAAAAAADADAAAEEHLCRPYPPIDGEAWLQYLKQSFADRAKNALAREQILYGGPAPETTSSSAVQPAVAYSHIFPLEPAPAPATSSSGLPRIATSAPTRPVAAGLATKQTSSGINRIIASARALVDKEIDDDVSTITCD